MQKEQHAFKKKTELAVSQMVRQPGISEQDDGIMESYLHLERHTLSSGLEFSLGRETCSFQMTIKNGFSREAEIQVRVLQLMARQSSNLNFRTPVQCSQSCMPCLAPGKQYGWALLAYMLCMSNVPAAMVLAQPLLAMYAALTLPEAFWLVGN